jgi:hypothetical protein
MKLSKILGVAAVAALALMAYASTASATTLETGGLKQSGAVTLEASANGSILLSATGGGFANTCTASNVLGTTSTFTGTTVSGPISSLTFSKCTNEPVTVDAAGTLSVEAITGTTNGTVRSNGAKVTVPSPFGTLTCTTSNTDIGTLTGVAVGTATMDINAVLNCGIFLPSAKWEGKYNLTTNGGKEGHAIGVVG